MPNLFTLSMLSSEFIVYEYLLLWRLMNSLITGCIFLTDFIDLSIFGPCFIDLSIALMENCYLNSLFSVEILDELTRLLCLIRASASCRVYTVGTRWMRGSWKGTVGIR